MTHDIPSSNDVGLCIFECLLRLGKSWASIWHLKEIVRMKEKKSSESTDQELLDKAKKTKSTSIINAVFIGAMIGIVFYSVAKNHLGWFTLIPLFLAYKLINGSKDDQ